MKRILLSVALLIGVLLSFLWYVNPALAMTDEIWPFMPDKRIDPVVMNGSLTEIDYYISSTGASSSTRYRTVRYYVVLSNQDDTTATFSFQPSVSAPPPGQTIIDKITVTAQDLLDAGFTPNSLLLANLNRISIGADIEIYNGNTIYRSIYNPPAGTNQPTSIVYPQLDQLGPDFGFGTQDINDMKTRYADSLLDLVGTSPTCSLELGTIDSQEQISGHWSEGYYTWETHSSTSTAADGSSTTTTWTSCDLTSTITGDYHDKLELSISQPDFPTVMAGQGTSVIVTTRYRNNDPNSWNGSSYTTGVNSMKVMGPDTDDWAQYKISQPQITENMVLQSTNVYYEYYMPESHSTGCNGGWFNVGYNVPVLEQTWVVPYARFDDATGWTRHQTPPTDIDNRYVFGGLNRWYFGFDIPDGQNFSLRFMAKGGVGSALTVCKGTTITILGGAYESFIVRTIDPLNPFPSGKPISWQGFENVITNLATWFREPEIEFQKRVEQWKTETLPGQIYTFLTGDVRNGVKNMQTP